jgi:hypothetical protein
MEAKTTDGGTAYVLNNVEGGSATMRAATGSSQSEWAANVNKKVGDGTGAAAKCTPAEDGASGKPKVLRPPMIQVESVKVIAESCK